MGYGGWGSEVKVGGAVHTRDQKRSSQVWVCLH